MIVHNASEYEAVHPYSKMYILPKDYPIQYPCVCIIKDEDGGISGNYKFVMKFYPGKDYDVKSYDAGIEEACKRCGI